jgi:Ca-activated chloride channel family protein
MMKQILLITDGCSNVGMDPVAAAANAASEGIVVNVIGIVDQGEFGERGEREVAEIAAAGGGMHRIVTSKELRRTMQMMTRQTVTMTIRRMVSEELKSITGEGDLHKLPPAKRSQVVQVIDDLSERAPLRVALLVDTSASMKPKLAAVEEAIRDLMLSLEAREGESELCVFVFPGKDGMTADAELLTDWTAELAKLNHLFYKLSMRGATPTGPAIMSAVRHYRLEPSARELNMTPEAELPPGRGESAGMLRDGCI